MAAEEVVGLSVQSRLKLRDALKFTVGWRGHIKSKCDFGAPCYPKIGKPTFFSHGILPSQSLGCLHLIDGI